MSCLQLLRRAVVFFVKVEDKVWEISIKVFKAIVDPFKAGMSKSNTTEKEQICYKSRAGLGQCLFKHIEMLHIVY